MKVLGVDLGGTQLRVASLDGDRLGAVHATQVPTHGSAETVLEALYASIEAVLDKDTVAIGVGVPSPVDPRAGLVRDAINLPGWRDLPLERLLTERYRRPVHIENDAN